MTQTNTHTHHTPASEEGSTPPQSVVERFEEAWEAGQRPLLDDYLPADGPERGRLLEALVHIDLERRLKAAEKARVETYLGRYPEVADNPELVLALIAHEYQLRRRHEPEVTPDEFVERFPERAAQVRERLERITAAPETGPASVPPGGVRYRRLRFHKQGGLGVVFVAQDEEVHREVALKQVKPEYSGDPEIRRRFLREAEITGRLEHPGIVPVYGVVQGADGQPCYAMRFIQGDSLRDAIQDFHQADKDRRDPGERSLALRQLLQRFITVCNTIAYAHSRGVIHRDLKPGNIMLGKYGETLVVDWGLARPFQRSDTERSSGEETLTPAGGEDETRLGQAQGTPAYMSPEQAAGRWDTIGPATDIYSLGATLYALLTGQPPYPGRSPAEIMQQVQRGEVTTPRQVKKEVPAALEAVCLKAMALKPQERYATALELAADLEHWLADEAVGAHPEPWRARLRRWARRHRVAVVGAAAALLVAAICFALATSLLAAANQELVETNATLEVSNARETEARTDAEDNFQLARDAVDDMLIEVGQQKLEDIPYMEEVRRNLLQKALEYYRGFVRKRGNDPRLRLELARAYWLAGNISSQLGRHVEAEDGYRQAIALLEKHDPASPDAVKARQYLAYVYHDLGNESYDRLELAQADKALRHAAKLLETLPVGPAAPSDRWMARHPNWNNRTTLGLCYGNLGTILMKMGRFDDAAAAFDRGIALQERLVADSPQTLAHYQDLATRLCQRSSLLIQIGRNKESEADCRRAMGHMAKAPPESGKHAEEQQTRAAIHNNLALLLQQLDHPDEAVKHYRRAVDLMAKLAAAFPGIPGYRNGWASYARNLAILLDDIGQPEEAQKIDEKALQLVQKLKDEFPDRPQYLAHLGQGLHGHALSLMNARKLPQAAKAFQQECALWQQLIGQFPEVPEYRSERALCLRTQGNLFLLTGSRQQAGQAYQQAIADLQQLVKSFPLVVQYRYDLTGVYVFLGDLHKDNGQFPQAEQNYLKGLEVIEKLVQECPRSREYRAALAIALHQHALLLDFSFRYPESEKRHREAIKRQQDLVADFPDLTKYWSGLANYQNSFGNLLTKVGRLAEAEKLHRESLQWKKRLVERYPTDPEYRNHLASSWSNLARVVQAQKHYAESEKAFKEAIALRKKLAADHPAVPEYALRLGRALSNYGELLRVEHKNAAAETAFREATMVLKGPAGRFADNPELQDELSKAHLRLGLLLLATGAADKGRENLLLALERVQNLAQKWPTMGYRLRHAQTLLALGKHPEAAALAEGWTTVVRNSALEHYNAACILASCGPLAEKDPNASEVERKERAGGYADRAVGLVQQAIQKGFRNLELLKTDPDLEPLRGRDDFKQLLNQLEKTVKQKS
jgi:serine/threonine-protein kinase